MTEVEIYSLKHNGQCLTFERDEDGELSEFLSNCKGLSNGITLEGKSYIMQYALGHEENIMCKVFKHMEGQGGIIAVFENSELLLIGHALDNLAYTEAIAHYAKMATYTRYGYDIFMD